MMSVPVSYQVFARKYRPQTFDEVVGQEHITRTLRNAIAKNRLAHAYLFVGPRGTGKTSTARIIAKALNCAKGPTTDPCGVCDMCREIAAGTSLDVLEIDGASNNGVEQVRDLRDNVRFAPARGKFKIYIIDEVHMLSSAAFNALLKTLEEPPEHVKFIFATTEPQKVLATILSRCQRFDLRRIPAPLIASHLRHIAGLEKIDLEEAAAEAIAVGADGGLRDAESMLDQLVAFCGDRIMQHDVLEVFGFTALQTISDFAGAILARDTPGALAILEQQADAGKDLLRMLADLLTHFRNLLVGQVDPKSLEAELGPALHAALIQQAGHIDSGRLLHLIDLFSAAEGRMKWASNKRLHLEIAVIKAIQTLGQASLDDVLDTLAALREGREPPARVIPVSPPASAVRPVVREQTVIKPTSVAVSAPAAPVPEPPPAAPTAPPSPEPAPVVPDIGAAALDVDGLWAALLEGSRAKMLVRSTLQMAAPQGCDGRVFRIGFPPENKMGLDTILRPANVKLLESILKEHSGAAIRVEAEIVAGLVVVPPVPEAMAPEVDLNADFLNDPKIKMALEVFKAEFLTPGKPGLSGD